MKDQSVGDALALLAGVSFAAGFIFGIALMALVFAVPG